MMKSIRSNRGATLIELIAGIAVLSIVGLASFTLLMFSIRTNNFIVAGSTASKDADLLNSRMELLFKEVVQVTETKENESSVWTLSSVDTEGAVVQASLTVEGDSLVCDEEVYCKNISRFTLQEIDGTSLVRISYTIDDRDFVKIFRLGGASSGESQP